MSECINKDHERFRGVLFTSNGCLACELELVYKTCAEAHRLLSKVVPGNQTQMIKWAVNSGDPVYTNAGAAKFVLEDVINDDTINRTNEFSKLATNGVSAYRSQTSEGRVD